MASSQARKGIASWGWYSFVGGFRADLTPRDPALSLRDAHPPFSRQLPSVPGGIAPNQRCCRVAGSYGTRETGSSWIFTQDAPERLLLRFCALAGPNTLRRPIAF